jgi:tetratricopeptide (TPR) repeat protein
MSPEQALGRDVDVRSDLFSLGIIFYEIITGVVPYQADTMLATMLKRTQAPPPPPVELDASIPKDVSDVILKCLSPDPANRYQSASELLSDLDILAAHYGFVATSAGVAARPGGGGASASVLSTSLSTSQVVTRPAEPEAPPTPPRLGQVSDSSASKWIALSMTAVLLILGAVYGLVVLKGRHAGPVAPMTVLIADFNNHTGDSVFSGTLESTLKLALEGASFISAYDRTRMRDLGLNAPEKLDDAKAQEIAASQGLNVVVSGGLDRRGAVYRLSVRAVQTVTGKVLATAEETAPNKDQALFAVTKLGIAVRKALGDATSESAQRLSMETLTAASLEAVHEYAAGLDAVSRGKPEEAIKDLTQAVDLDENFGMAYTILATATANVGRRQDADKYIREALRHIDHMTERERFRTRANFYRLTGDDQKCVDEYSALLEKYPSDTGAYNNISFCLTDLRMLPKAVDAARHAVAILPKRAIYHGNAAAYSAFAGDFQSAAKEAAESLKLGLDLGYVAQAYADLGQEQVGQAAEAYANFKRANPSLGVTALADLAGYEGRFQEAVSLLEKGAADDMAGRRPEQDAAADKLSALAYVQFLRGQKGPALDAAKRSLELNQAVRTRFLTGRVYAAFGDSAKAHKLAASLSAETQLEPQAYGRLIEGEIALKNVDGATALKLFTEANALLDTWIGRFDLGRAYLDTGAFTEADSEFDRCLRRRGEALSLFLDPVPTYSYFPLVYYYQGRAREGMKTTGFVESYKKYLAIRGKAAEDPLLAEVRRRAGL